MPVVHTRDELLAVCKTLSERAFADGVLWDVPKARRREQATNPQRPLRLGLEGDLKLRMATQVNRYVEKFGKQLGWDLMLKRLELDFTDEELGE